MRLLAAPDKFRDTLSAREASEAIARGAQRAGWEALICPLSDGGEGFRQVFDGEMIPVAVHGPLGEIIVTSFTLQGSTAIVEMADAAGRSLLPLPTGDDPIAASTEGVGELVLAAIDHGATTIIVGCGGSATTDGGKGAVDVLDGFFDSRRCELLIAVDVQTMFADAARVFAPQKGADVSQVELLVTRLNELTELYRSRFGIDVSTLSGAGAAGGLAGGLAALGGRIVSGFGVVADIVGLDGLLEQVDLVVTGEGLLDTTTFEGKTVASLIARVGSRLPVLIVAGRIETGVNTRFEDCPLLQCRVTSLEDHVGVKRSFLETSSAISEVVEGELRQGWPAKR